MKYASRIYLCLIFGILYIPIVTLMLFSFNAENSTAEFTGFSLKWYLELFNSPETFTALRNTLILAVLSALLATVIGTLAAEGIYRMKNKLVKSAITSVTNIPMMNPDIVTGMSMMLFFAAVMGILALVIPNISYNDIGFAAMLIAHTTFCLPYVILSVLPRLTELGDTMSEAALDLGCTPLQAFIKVKLPNIMPAVLSGMVMAFTLSLDDFVISYFVGPSNFQTLPLLIYSMTKKKVTPDMYALSTIIIVTVFILLIISNFKSDKPEANTRKKKIASIVSLAVAAVLIVAIIIGSFFGGSVVDEEGNVTAAKDVIVLNVYNWGEYISDGFDGSLDVNKAFTEYFNKHLSAKYGGKKVEINYTTYATNEDMYSKLSNSAVKYDIVIPSDYMIEKMIAEDMLLAFDAKSLPNYDNILDEFKGSYYDENDMYSVPYTYGMVGIIYNKTMVDKEDLGSWDLLWNDKYAGKILQFNNPRDAFATAMYLDGLDVNSKDPEVWNRALELLMIQKPYLQGYVNDEIFNKMTTESAAIAPYFVGDFLIMADQEENLGFYFPEEGVNYFVDAMCIPKNAEHPEIAKEYINFMLSEEPAVANAEYIGYASPNKLVIENEEYIEYMTDYAYEGENGETAYDLLYSNNPAVVNKAYNEKIGSDNAACYRNFTPEIQSRVNTLWENLKLADATELWVHITAITIVVAVVALAVYSVYIKKKRSRFYRYRDRENRKAKANTNS
ncbi:MAG: extracellular solute-binding protein [Clostridia bacterium]|nr:extracellular solute-binding protein [Clostridia bacterium]